MLCPQVETALAFEYKSIAEKHVSNSFHSAFSYVTSLLVVHIPFTFIVLIFFFKFVHGAQREPRVLLLRPLSVEPHVNHPPPPPTPIPQRHLLDVRS